MGFAARKVALVLIVLAAGGSNILGQTFTGPTPYLSENDSPFLAGINAGTIRVETFETSGLRPGVTASAGSRLAPGGLTDSVDGDDCVINGSGTAGYSFFSGSGAAGITFTFDAGVLGSLPTQAGVVWTDGSGTTLFEAFGPGGTPLGTIGPVAIADGSNFGTTAEDRFFGVTHGAGISSIRISNTSGGIEVDHLQFTDASAPPIVTDCPPTITNGPPPGGTLGIAYSFSYTSTRAPTFSVTAGALPPGLTLSPAGAISGTPTTAGTFAGTVTATNGNAPNATQNFSITIAGAAPPPPTITNGPPPGGTTGVVYSFAYTSTGSPTFSVSSGSLPPGLSLSASGVISGTPTAAGTFTGTVSATNGTAPDASQNFSIMIAAAVPPPAITNGPPPSGTAGVVYSFTYTSTGSPMFSVTAGALPPGLSLNSSGVISGTPTTAGTFTGTVSASNGSPPDAVQNFSITIEPACELVCSALVPAAAGQNEAVTFAGDVRIEPATCELFLPSFRWSFGDGTSSNEPNPAKVYSQPGTYQWQLTVFSGGRSCIQQGQITIRCTLDCNATVPARGVANEAVRFNVTAAVDPGCNLAPPAFLWEFGDGSTSTQQNPDKAYTAAGTYDWAVTVVSGNVSCRRSGRIEVSLPCELGCSARVAGTALENQVIGFDGSATPGSACPIGSASFRWNFGDGTSSSEQRPAKFYPAAGTYPWQMTAALGTQQCTRSGEVMVTSAPPSISVTRFPGALVQPPTGGGVTSQAVQNEGGAATEVTLTQTGSFFVQSPTRFILEPGASQIVSVTGLASESGSFEGSVNLSGLGVPEGLSVPLFMLSSDAPDSRVVAVAVEPRVDVSSEPGASPAGRANFTNTGTESINGILSSDVPWIIPQPGGVTIPSGATATVSFTIDPSLRTDGEYGTAVGSVILEYQNGTSGKTAIHSSHGTATAAVAVHHTSSPGSQPAQIPPLADGEIAIYLPGVANVAGSVGSFLSDVGLTNLTGFNLTGVRLFYKAIGSATPRVSNLSQIIPGRPLVLSDLAKSVFGTTNSAGTLHIRSNNTRNLAASAIVLNTTNARGTVGMALPAFRSDRGAGPGEQSFVTGLQADANTHTNLYVQEVSGHPSAVAIDFYDADGVLRGGRNEVIEAFGLLQLGSVVPEGAVSAILTTTGDSPGRLIAYATPVDETSGDTWAVTDWRRHSGVLNGASMIPVVASLEGLNDARYRTDLWMLNSEAEIATGTLTFRPRGGDAIERSITLGPRESLVVRDVLESRFEISGDAIGSLVYTPIQGGVVMTSRIHTAVEGGMGSLGTTVPSVPIALGLTEGQVKRFGAVDDASRESITLGRAGTYRTNLGIVEVSGQPAVIRVTLSFASGTQSSAAQSRVVRIFQLGAGEFFQLNEISRALIGPSRDTRYGDLRNMQLEVEVMSETGAVIPFISSLDNGSGDSIFRLD